MGDCMASRQYDVSIVGGGIIGLATALRLTQRYPRCRVAVFEKEEKLAVHQTGHNSGVIHSGIYYRPGSQKAQFCVSGVNSLIQFCQENSIDYETCGKVIVATDESEFGRLEDLYQRGTANGVEGLEMMGPERLKEIEPHTSGIKALYGPGTGIVDYKAVSSAYADRIRDNGGEVLTDSEVVSLTRSDGCIILETTQGSVGSKYLINCAGLYADKVARMMGVEPGRQDYTLQGGVLYPQPPEPASGEGANLSRAGPQVPLPGSSFHQEHSWGG